MKKWPCNPVNLVIQSLHHEPDGTIVADMGCGPAKIAEKLNDRLVIHSFDLVATNERVVACDMSKVSDQYISNVYSYLRYH